MWPSRDAAITADGTDERAPAAAHRSHGEFATHGPDPITDGSVRVPPQGGAGRAPEAPPNLIAWVADVERSRHARVRAERVRELGRWLAAEDEPG